MCGKSQTVLYFLLSFRMIGGTALCTHGSYLNLCGYCVGGTTDKSDIEGLDRCGICNGQSDCVGCDGIINSPRKRDTCGLCLSPDAEQWNDCQKIESIYPSVLDLSVDSAPLPLTIMGAGLAQSDMNTTQCHFFPLESQPESPTVQEISLEDSEIQVKVFLGKSSGMYKIGCSEIENFAELRIVDSRRIDVVNVKPSEVSVDEEVELEVEISEDRSGNTNGTYWCFVRMRTGEAQTLRAISRSGTSFKCSQYTATAPGVFYVGIVAREDAAVGENTTGRTAELLSRAKPPIPETAAYAPDLQYIAIKFDQNIKILDCNRTFSPETELFLGKGFACFVVADTLYITPGNEMKAAESLTIIDSNSIRRAGSSGPDLSPNSKAVTLPVSKKNVMTPRFTLSSPNVVCFDKIKEPVINVKLSRLGKQNLSYTWVAPPSKEFRGRSQRENMLMWKHARALEVELNNNSEGDIFFFNRTRFHPGFTYILNLRSNNVLGNHHDLKATLPIPEEGNISITVTTFPSASVIIAEVRVTFCRDEDRPILRYSWKVEGNIVSEDGKLLIIPQAIPGIYNVSCIVHDHSNNQVLGVGWSLAEVVKLPQPVIIFPTRTVVGTMDDIILQANSGETQFRWSCATPRGEPCITVGPKATPVEDMVDVTSPTVRIPSGTLAVGSYIWRLNGMESPTAVVTVSANIPPLVKVVSPQQKVDSTTPLSLNADVERLKPGCRIRWKTIRRKGYHYFDLQEDVGLGDLMEIKIDDPMMGEREVPLVIPPARGKWEGLTGGATYLLRIQTVCPEPIPEAYTDITVAVNAPPSGTDFRITPETGEAVNTKFSITISEGSDSIEDYPFVYRVGYQDETDEIQMGVSALADFTVRLPPGNLTVTVQNCDIQNSCSKSSKLVVVQKPDEITADTIKEISEEIRNDMFSGDTTNAYGKAITALKSLSQRQTDKEKLDEILSVTQSAIRDRLRDLTARLHSDPKLIKTSFEFLQQSVTSLKFLPDTKELVNTLTEFKNLITKQFISNRRKRETISLGDGIRFNCNNSSIRRTLERSTRDAIDVKMNENTMKAIFDLHAKILEQNNTDSNKEEFFKDVRKYMIESCGAVQDSVQGPILIESSIVTLDVMKLTQNHIKNYLQITGASNAKLRFDFKSIPRKTCAAIAKYEKDFMGITKMLRVSDVFEVHLIKNGTFKDNFKDDIKSMVITLPLHNNDSQEILDCMTWSKDKGWKSTCTVKEKTGNAITCICKNLGVFSAFAKINQIANDNGKPTDYSTMASPFTNITASIIATTAAVMSTTTTIVTTTSNNVNTNTTAVASTTTSNISVMNISKPSNNSVVITVQLTTATDSKIISTTPKTNITADKVVPTSVKEDTSNIKENTKFYISGTFVIEEDYEKTIGKNETQFKKSLKKQLSQQLSISDNSIANLIIAPGSILVTVLFVDTEEVKAEAAIKELYAKLQDGSLRLTSQNTTALNVPQQDLKVKVGKALTRNTGKVRLITYGVVAGTLIIIFFFATGAAYFKRKRTRIPFRLPRLSIDDHPTYRQFHNEFSLDGSSVTLERYRRNHPFETETM